MSSEFDSNDLPVEKRAELLAELFLQELQPGFLVRAPKITEPFDFMIGFKSPSGGVHTSFVEVKSIKEPVVQDSISLRLKAPVLDLITQSIPPVLLLLVDPKASALYYAWGQTLTGLPHKRVGNSWNLQVPVTEITESTRRMLLAELTGATSVAHCAS